MRSTLPCAALSLFVLVASTASSGAGDLSAADSLRTRHRKLVENSQIMPAIAAASKELALRRTADGGDALELAVCLQDLSVYEMLAGHYERADTLASEALAICRSASGTDPTRVADALALLTRTRMSLTRLDEARAFCDDALAIRRAKFGDLHEKVADATYWSGWVEFSAREFKTALPLFEEALAMRQGLLGREHLDVADAMVGVGATMAMVGNLAASERMLRDAIAVQDQSLPPGHFRRAAALMKLAYTMRSFGELEECAELLREYLTVVEASSPAQIFVNNAVNNLAVVERDLGNYEEAYELAKRAADECRVALGDRSLTMLYRNANLALLEIYLEHYAAASKRLADAHALEQDLAGDGVDTRHIRLTIISHRSLLSMHVGDYDAAEKYLQEAMDYGVATGIETHREFIGGLERMSRIRIGKGDIEGAEVALEGAVRLFEEARERAGEGTRPATFHETPYEARAALRLRQGRAKEAWNDLERARGRLLADALFGEEVPFDVERVQASIAPREVLIGWLDYDELPGRSVSWAFVLRHEGPVQWRRLGRPDGDDMNALAARMTSFRAGIASVGGAAFVADNPERWPESGRAVWRERFAPIADVLDGADALVIVPSAVMAGMPIDAIVDDGGTLLCDRFAIRLALSGSVHAWLMERRGGSDEVRSGLLVGDPAYCADHLAEWTPADSPDEMIEVSALRSAKRGDPEAIRALPRLPWSRVEAEAIAQVLPDAAVLLGADASKEALSQLTANGHMERFDIIHLATHAFVDDRRPGASALILAQVDRHRQSVDPSSSILTADEIGAGWKCDAELVTLSACETALGRRVFGEGVVGFAHPLFVSGAKSVLASLWPVNDESCALLMQRFYIQWLSGAGGEGRATSKADALQAAKQWLRDWEDDHGNRPYSHPYHWAAYVLVGR